MYRTLGIGAIVIGILAGVFIYMNNKEYKPDPSIIAMKEYIGPTGQIEDPMNELGVKKDESHPSPTIGYEQDGIKFKIYYGNQVFKVNVDKDSQEVFDILGKLGIQFNYRNDGYVKLTYQGKVMSKLE